MKITAFATVAALACVAWAASSVAFSGDGRSLSTINGSVEASSGQTYDSLSAVNGEVHVRSGATVGNAKTVNGEITVDSGAKVGRVSTVNGSLEIAEDVTITENASTVNGELTVAKRSRVGGDVSTVSGEIELKGAEVTGMVSTVNGDIELTDGARVRGNLMVKRPSNGWRNKNDQRVRVHICGTCVVEGELRFEHPVELRVEKGAQIGAVIGDDVKRL